MYDVTIQNGNEILTIHDHHSASTSQKLASGSIVDAENSISSFTFTIYPNNAGYDKLNAYTTLIKVRNTKRSKDEFVGRLLQVNPEMDSNGMVSKTVICEDRLGYLHDSIQPYAEMRHFVGDVSRSGLEEFIDVLLANHNAQVEPYKRIYRGTVTVKPFESSDDVTKGLNWQSTFDAIKEKLLNSFGGFIRLRESAGTLYLDYLASIGSTRSTRIELGRNMRSASKEIDPSGIVTRVIPLGAKLVKDDGNGNEVETEERLTIAEINNGLDYIESIGYAQQFGIKYGTVIFDDVTDTANLLRKGTEWLTANNGLVISHKVDALDLSLIGLDIDDFVLHDSYPVKNALIGTNDILKIIKKTTNIIEPQNSSFEMGSVTKRFSDMIIDEMLNIGTTNGTNGLNGKNSYLHIMYSANADGSGMTERPDNTTAYMGTCSCASPEPPTDPAAYRWSLIRGTVSYTWVKYADSPTSGMSDNPEGKKYIGLAYNKTSEAESERYSDYSWSLIKGEDGIDGVDGENGVTFYTWVKYADNASGANMSNDPTGKFYIGLAYNKESPIESNVASDYTWSLFRGSNGVDGKNGVTYYTWIKYADSPTSGMSDNPDGKKYIGLAYNKTSATESNYYSDYTWSLIKGEDGAGIKSVVNYYLASNQSSGVTTSTSGWTTNVQVVSSNKRYLWNYEVITYTNNSTTTTTPCIVGNYANDGLDGKDGVGVVEIREYYARSTSNTTEPSSWETTVPTLTPTYKYLWNYETIIFTNDTAQDTKKRVIGVYGDTGVAGVGVLRIVPRYAVGTSETAAPSTPTVAGWSISAPELSYGEYLWCAYYIQYTDGTDAWTTPFHARSADQIKQTDSIPENPTVGTLWLDTRSTPYVLRRFNGTYWETVSDYSSEFEEVYTYITDTAVDAGKLEESILAKVEETTTSKSVYEEFSTIVKNILNMEADGTTMIFQTINQAIQDVMDTEQTHYEERKTYIRFNENGIEIGKSGNAITMQLDNDSLDFYNNGTRVAYISDNQLYISDGRFLRSVRIGNYGFIPEANGSVSFTYLGGDS